jgi:hypothetical protein
MVLRTMLLRLITLVAATTTGSAQDYCNICGQGNLIQFPTGVVSFEYPPGSGQPVENNCERWQQVVKNANVVSDDFCRNEMLQYTVEPCRCVAPDGELLSEVLARRAQQDDETNTLSSLANLELQSEYGPDHLNRTSLITVIDSLPGGREELEKVRPEGQTFLGCRIRAFNRMEEYLPQTINNSTTALHGEFLNPDFAEETFHNFLQYNIIPQNIYEENLQKGMAELTTPVADCGHMWITYSKQGELCFNNGCVVQTQETRQYLASNGYVHSHRSVALVACVLLTSISSSSPMCSVGYVIDKCQVCPGIAMLVGFAAETIRRIRPNSSRHPNGTCVICVCLLVMAPT